MLDVLEFCILEITFRVIGYCNNCYSIFQGIKHIIFVIMLLRYTLNGCFITCLNV